LAITKNGTATANSIVNEDTSVSILEIDVPIAFSNDGIVEVISHYAKDGQAVSTFAFRKGVGKGEIIYAETLPYFSVLQELDSESKRLMFSQLGSLIRVLNLALPETSSATVNRFSIATDEITFIGHVKFDSDSFLLSNTDDIQVSYLEYEDVNLSDVTIEDFEIKGLTESIIEASQAQIPLFSGGTYTPIVLSNSFNWTLKISDDATVILSLLRDNQTHDVVVQGGFIKLTLPECIAWIKTPTLFVDGETFFERFHSLPVYGHPIESHWVPVKIEGNTSFRVDYVDRNAGFISDLSFNGTSEVFSPEPRIWNEWNSYHDIPWRKVLTSFYHVMLVVVIFVGYAVYYGFKRLRRRRLFS